MVLLRRFWLATVCLCAPALAVPAVAQGFDSGGFNSGGSGSGFAGGGFNSPRGFNVAGFNSAPLPAAGIFGGICGRMLIPAASVGEMSRGFFPGHAGVDLVAVIGTPVRAAAGGVVAHAGRDEAYGNFIDIRHAGGISTRYGHLSAFAPNLTAGAGVLTGSVIGQVGTTGNSTGPHLHFEVRISGAAVDPLPFLTGTNCERGRPRQELLEARDAGRRTAAR